MLVKYQLGSPDSSLPNIIKLIVHMNGDPVLEIATARDAKATCVRFFLLDAPAARRPATGSSPIDQTIARSRVEMRWGINAMVFV